MQGNHFTFFLTQKLHSSKINMSKVQGHKIWLMQDFMNFVIIFWIFNKNILFSVVVTFTIKLLIDLFLRDFDFFFLMWILQFFFSLSIYMYIFHVTLKANIRNKLMSSMFLVATYSGMKIPYIFLFTFSFIC